MSRPTKILYVITKSNWGGAQRYVFDLATGLPTRNYQLETVVALGGAGELKQSLNAAGVRTISIPRLRRDVVLANEIAVFFSLLKIYREEQPDIVHLNSSKIGALGALAARVYGLRFLLKPSAYSLAPRVVFTAHGWYFNEPRSRLARWVTLLISWLTVLLSHKVICVAEHDRQQMLRCPFTRKKLVTIYNGIAPRPLLEKQAARGSLLGYLKRRQPMASLPPVDGIWIGSIGELHRNKAFPFALEAHARLLQSGHEAHLAIIGEGEDRALLESLVRHHDTDRAYLLGTIPEAAMYLSAFDVFILPSRKEGLPYVLLEAGMVGLAVVATTVGGVPEIIEHGESGLLVAPADPDALHKALVHLVEDEAARTTYATKLKQRTETRFSLETMLQKTTEVYEKLLS